MKIRRIKERVMDLEKPVIFNTQMVQEILKGNKTQTRRIIKNKYDNSDITFFENKYGKRLVYMQNDVPAPVKNQDGTTSHKLIAMEEVKKPCNIGDILWVRETWANTWTPDGQEGYVYKADGEPSRFPYWGNEKQCKDEVWIPSIHMPRIAARILLKVTDIRAERLQDITEDEARKEGCFMPSYKDGKLIGDSVTLFKILWDSIYKNWSENPWVWVIEFEKVVA
jgi:hypothetical protein